MRNLRAVDLLVTYFKRLVRMTGLLVAHRVTWLNFLKSLRPAQKSVSLVGGGVVFCDRKDERRYFQEETTMCCNAHFKCD